MTTELYEFRRVDPPLPAPLIAELLRFWKTIFQGDFSGFDAMLAGKESQLNRHSVYLAEQRGKIAATCRMGISLSDPRLACLGEVATAPEHRGHNLTTRLCCQAVYDFDHADGQAFFLGTVNPVAAKIYTRLGWRYLAGTKVMLRTSSGLTPEEFMVDYFRQGLELPVKVAPGTTACRISMIPLILTPHDWVVLDANTSIFSTRYFTQKSCEGLFPRYQYLPSPAAWFAATRSDGVIVGLASVQIRETNIANVDAFAHHLYQEKILPELYSQAAAWARSQNASAVFTTAERHDPLKHQALHTLGFVPDGRTHTVQAEGSPLELVLYEIQNTGT